MNREGSCVLLILLMKMILIVRGGHVLQDHQIDRICSGANQMILSGLSEIGIKTLLETELTKTINELIREKWPNKDYSDTQAIDITNKDKIGKNGLHSQLEQIGVNSANGDFFNTLFFRQASNQFRDSEISELSINVNPVIKQRTLDIEMDESDVNRTNLVRSEKSSKPFVKECENIAQSVYNRELTRLSKSRYSLGSEGKRENPPEIPQQRARFVGKQNSTSINAKIGIGPNGHANYVTNIIRGNGRHEATGTASNIQDHGDYKNSVIDITGIEIVSVTDQDANSDDNM